MFDSDIPEDPDARPDQATPTTTTSTTTTATTATDTSAPLMAPVPAASGAPSSETTPDIRSRRARPGLRAVLGASLLSAVLASSATFGLISISMDRSPAPGANPTADTVAANTAAQTEDSDLTSVIAAARESVVTVTATVGTGRISETGVGSGLILTSNGYILTNRHVVEGARSLSVKLLDGATYDATVVKVSDTTDLALIKVSATGLKAARLGNSDQIQVGETALAIGSPLGTYTETVTRGIVSATGRDITVRDDQTGQPTTLRNLIQTDAAVNGGNSGGPLLDAAGNVIGINTAVAASAQALGFSIPINAAQSLVALAQTSAA